MKSLLQCILSICFVFGSCNQENKPAILTTKDSIATYKSPVVDSSLIFFTEGPDLFKPNLSKADSFLLFHEKPFDTCSFLKIQREGEFYSGQYLYYPPSYYNQFPGDNTVFIYKAINFKL